MALETALAGAILFVSLLILVLVWRLRGAVRSDPGPDTDQLVAALSTTWREMELDRTVGQIELHASEMQQLHTDIRQMLRTPRERGEFGEQQLDVILSDHLPPEMYGIREQVVDGKTPDAHIRSSAGRICIDAKFPLDNYERYVETDDPDEAERYRRAFASDVEGQLQKIAQDYVRPEAGTTDFAFAFIPSEGVYYHLVTEEYDMLRAFTRQGVQVVSPLTFGHKLELIRADVQAQKLSEQAETIRERLQGLDARFRDLEEEWQTLHRHLRNAKNKADDVDRQYESLRAEFDRIEEPATAEADGGNRP
ncbi:DNA recombination protein RmuC [Halobacteriaceae archaeon GCM10025711]